MEIQEHTVDATLVTVDGEKKLVIRRRCSKWYGEKI